MQTVFENTDVGIGNSFVFWMDYTYAVAISKIKYRVYFTVHKNIRQDGLASDFAYLPFAGERYLYLYISEMDKETGYENILYEGNATEGLGYETEYDVTVHSKQDLFCNLPEKERNHFVGTSDGVTLVGNPFLVKEEIQGASVIHSKVDVRYSVRNLKEDSSIIDMRESWKKRSVA